MVFLEDGTQLHPNAKRWSPSLAFPDSAAGHARIVQCVSPDCVGRSCSTIAVRATAGAATTAGLTQTPAETSRAADPAQRALCPMHAAVPGVRQ